MLYEINYLVLQSKEGELSEIRKSIKELIVTMGAEIKEEKEFLKRKLAYEIEKELYGFHTVLRFGTENPGEFIDQLNKKLDLSSKIARHIIVKADELPPLKEMFSKEREEQRAKFGDTIKQEDVGKILAQEKVKEQKAVEKKNEAKPVTEKEVAPAVSRQGEEKKAVAEEALDVEEVKKEDEKKEERKKKREKDDEGKLSLDDLDEKLDEILNI